MTRPNVLFVCTDQQFAGAMSCAGNDDVDTPAMDRLAAEGTRFAESYCTAPVCTPSRGSLLTGRMPHVTGVTDNGDAIPDEYREESLGRLFADAGYDCGWAGKWHVPSMGPVDEGHGFEALCGFSDENVVDACIDFLDRDRDAPFFVTASFDDPHNICEYGRGQNLPWGEVDEPRTRDCPSLPANFGVPPFEPEPIRPALEDEQYALGAMSDASPEEWRHYRNAYYRLVERVDARIGRLLDALDDRGVADETLVVFLSDHGDGVGAHQVNQKWLLYEETARVPLIVRPPGDASAAALTGDENADGDGDGDGYVPRGQVDDHLVSLLDLLPTLCDYAGVDHPPDLPGYSLRPLAAGETPAEWREFLVTETEEPVRGRMIRTERYKYKCYAIGRHREQLFDMDEDRGEMVDLSVNSEYDDVLDEHRRHLLRWSRETDDVFASRGAWPDAPVIPGFDLGDIDAYMRGGPEPPR